MSDFKLETFISLPIISNYFYTCVSGSAKNIPKQFDEIRLHADIM